MNDCSPKIRTNSGSGYIGRFAPSPTGLLHFGSLLTAVASWLQARQQNGQWIIRIEDLDPPREQAGASDTIIRTLANWGMESDQTIWFQSERLAHYQSHIEHLLDSHQAYRCYCSRKEVATAGLESPEGWRYNGHCRDHNQKPEQKTEQQHCIRFDSRGDEIQFNDELQGSFSENPEQLFGDFPIQRADGYIAYQLATVVDDHAQGISHIVRGIDLLSSTSRQIRLQQALQFARPEYCHLPIVLNSDGQKLSKQTHAPEISETYSASTLIAALRQLKIAVPENFNNCPAQELLDWAKDQWKPLDLIGKKTINNVE